MSSLWGLSVPVARAEFGPGEGEILAGLLVDLPAYVAVVAAGRPGPAAVVVPGPAAAGRARNGPGRKAAPHIAGLGPGGAVHAAPAGLAAAVAAASRDAAAR